VIPEGADVPGFELPALVDGEKRRVALSEYLGDDVVILAFYPADFNPACDAESCDLDELDLFTMQKDVRILGISPDSVYSHRAFAQRYDLKIPLLADTDGEVAERYDISLADDIGQSLIERGVAVVDHDGTVTYSWSTDDMTELPRVEEIKDALAETGGDDTAFARYRVGHAHYTEGRRSFTSAMESFENTEWVMAQHDFQQACEEFEAAADRFDTAVRFVDDASLVPIYEGANEKATALWQAADWLTRAASAYSSGSGSEGQELRDDAEIPLSTVREYREPPDPDDEWPPEIENLEKAESDDHSILPTEPDVEDAALEVDIDEEAPDDEGAPESVPQPSDDADVAAATADDGEAGTDDGGEADSDDDIDDDELAEIQAELAANNPDSEPSVEELDEESTAIVEAPPMGNEGESADESEAEATAQGTEADTTVQGADGAEASAEDTTVEADTDTDDAAVEADADADDAAVEADTDTDDAAVDADADADDAAVEADDTATETTAEPSEATASPTDEQSGESPAADADGAEASAGEAHDSTAGAATGVEVSEDADADESEDDGPDLQLELAEPDPDPIETDGPPSMGESEGPDE